jgi:cyclase
MRKKMFLGASNLIFANAKRLRSNLTHSEMVPWGYLKTRPLGCKFRRQHPLGIYIADFYCHALKLVIEVDGNIHEQADVIINDNYRESILENEGLTILRFKNDEIDKSLSTVVERIENYIINTKNKPL